VSNRLFDKTLLDYINVTTESQWSQIDLTQARYFSTASLDAALKELEDQMGRKTPLYVTHDTHRCALGDWVGEVTLAELQRRMNALETQYEALAASDPSWAIVRHQFARSNDLTYLGVYLYGLGIADGLYVEKSNSADQNQNGS
jgi:hypothetical protein